MNKGFCPEARGSRVSLDQWSGIHTVARYLHLRRSEARRRRDVSLHNPGSQQDAEPFESERLAGYYFVGTRQLGANRQEQVRIYSREDDF